MKRCLKRFAREDSGSALLIVILMSVVLFMLVTSLLLLQQYYLGQVQARSSRVDATHIADAGLNDYLYHIKNNSTYYTTVPDTGWVAFGGGRYDVVAHAPINGEPLTLYATGSADNTITIVATIRYPTFADYMFLSDGDITFGTNAVVNGQVRSNGSVDNDGKITGKTFAVGTITGSGQFGLAKYPNYARADFSQIAVKMDDIMVAAKSHSPQSYFKLSGKSGYFVTFNGSSYTVKRVTGGSSTGDFSAIKNTDTTYGGTYTIPADGAIYFDDTVWISGNYGANVTVSSSKDIYFYGSYQRTSSTAKYTSGIISKSNIIVPSWYTSVPQDMLIEAAVLAKEGKFYADMQTGVFRNSLTFHGAATYKDATGGFVSVYSNGTDAAGFRNRAYNYDQALDVNPPQFYPPTGDGSLKVATWIDNRGVR